MVGGVFSAGSFSRRVLKALKVEREDASSFAFPRLRPRVAEAGIMDSRAESFFSGAEMVVVVRLIEAFNWAISAFVRSRAVGLRRSGEGVGEGDGDRAGTGFFEGAGAGGGGDGDFVGGSLGAGEEARGWVSLKLHSRSRSSSISRSGLLAQLCIHNSRSSYQSLPPQRWIQGSLAIVVCRVNVVEEVVDYCNISTN